MRARIDEVTTIRPPSGKLPLRGADAPVSAEQVGLDDVVEPVAGAGSFGPPMPAFATRESSGSSIAAKTCDRSRMSHAVVVAPGTTSRSRDSSRASRVRRAPSAARRSAIGATDAGSGAGDDSVLAGQAIHARESTGAARAIAARAVNPENDQ